MRVASLLKLALKPWKCIYRCAWLVVVSMVLLASSSGSAVAAPQSGSQGVSSREARKQAIQIIPFRVLTPDVGKNIREVVEKPSFYRRMPTRQIECEPDMFRFLVRRPEVMVNIWDFLGITKVSAERVSPYSFYANDGVGTTCRCDLVYGDNSTHIYFGNGAYDGSMAPKKVKGRCVCILRSQTVQSRDGKPIIRGTMDVFLRLDSFGADLLTRTIGPFVGKTADHNFVETATFIAQINEICERSPGSAYGLAMSLDKVDANVRREFAVLATKIARKRNPDLDLFSPNRTTAQITRVDTGQQDNRQPVANAKIRMLSPVGREEGGAAARPEPGLRISRLETVERTDFGSDDTPAIGDEYEVEYSASPTIAPEKSSLIMRR